MQIPQVVEEIIEKLQDRGYEAYAVGGCVRDMLLGREPQDWDITTSARPEQVKELFPRTIDTGIQHGTVTVMVGKEGYEVTTYRIDGVYEDGRHPKEVSFTSDLLEDLRRRDFTINAMAYSPQTGIVDAFAGKSDLEEGIIRCVGAPMERFNEDALRILRAIRFSAQLGFAVDPETWDALTVAAPKIEMVSKERIYMELNKLLLSERPGQICQVFEAGISNYIGPAFAAIPWRSVTISSALPQVKFVRWAAFLRFVTEERAAEILKDLKLDNDTIRKVRILVSWSGFTVEPDKTAVRRAMSRMEAEVWDALLDLYETYREPGIIGRIRLLAREIRESGDCLSLSDLAVGGQELMDAGMRPGVQIGEMLKHLLDHVLEHPGDNRKEILLELAGSAFHIEMS